MRYLKVAIPLFVVVMVFVACPRRQAVEPVEEPIPYEEVELPVELPEEPAKPELVLERIFFDFDKSDIRMDAAAVLEKNAEMLKLYPDVKVTIEGHCCRIGTAEYNLALGERRAKAARGYLIGLGIAGNRLATVSYGEERPLDPNNLPRNRRCEFVVQ
jgi:peptidoglycan-associated lipoprotein